MENVAVRLEIRQVVVLLQSLVSPELVSGPVTVKPLRRDRIRHRHGVRQAAVDVVLDGGPLVVEHRGARDPQQGRRHRDVVRAVTEGNVEAPASSPAYELTRAG